jgi:cell fate (sporulation/competence/biofilm development) regulator YmcA (YheA/YmcA/DUF963 family)
MTLIANAVKNLSTHIREQFEITPKNRQFPLERVVNADSKPGANGHDSLIPSRIYGTRNLNIAGIFLAKEPNSQHADQNSELRLMQKQAVDPRLMQKIQAYCMGTSSIHSIVIDGDNYKDVLYAVKCHDLIMKDNPQLKIAQRTSYALRTQCLEASAGRLMTFEAYTKSIATENYAQPFSEKSKEYAANISNYVQERQGLHAKITMGYVAEMAAMSERFDLAEPTLFALGGNTAAGKSFMAKNDPELTKGIDEQGQATGSLNPDTVKTRLRFGQNNINDNQIHIEGCALSNKISMELYKKAIKTSMVVDKRLSNTAEINHLIKMANLSGKKIVFKDIDTPLLLSCLRVLCRNIKNQPAVSFDVIARGYMEIREQRQNVIDIVRSSDTIKNYQLYVNDSAGNCTLAAEKKNGEWRVANQHLLDEAVSGRKPAEQLVADLKETILSPALYAHYVKAGIKPDKLRPYQGRTLQQALTQHSDSLPQWDGIARRMGTHHYSETALGGG